MIDKHKEKDAILTMEIDQKVRETRKLWGTDAFELHASFIGSKGIFSRNEHRALRVRLLGLIRQGSKP